MCFAFFSTIIFLDIVGALNMVVSLLAPDVGETTDPTNTSSEAVAEAGQSEPGAKTVGLVLLEVFGLLVLLLTNATALHGLRLESLFLL